MSCFLIMSIPFIMDTVEKLIINDKIAFYRKTNSLLVKEMVYVLDAMILFLINKYLLSSKLLKIIFLISQPRASYILFNTHYVVYLLLN